MKPRGILVALLLLVFFSPSTTAAPPKPGATCSKAGITMTYQGLKYTCIKSGKKLVWGKGIKSGFNSNESGGKSTSTPTPTPTPMPTPTPTPESIIKALTSVWEFPRTPITSVPISFHIGPNADAQFAIEIKNITQKTFEMWRDFYDDTRPYPVIFGGLEDIDWVFEQWAKYGYTDINQKNEAKKRALSGGFTSVLFMRAQGHMTFILSPTNIKGFGDAYREYRETIITHHVIHAIQQRVTSEKYDLLGCWAIEGGAEFYGAATAAKVGQLDYMSYRRTIMGNWAQWRRDIDLRKYSAEDWLVVMKNFDQTPCNDTSKIGNLHYSIGFLMTETLVSEFGHAKVLNWWKAIKTSEDWKKNFENTFGLSYESWYKNEAVPYLIEQYRNWTPNPWWEGVL